MKQLRFFWQLFIPKKKFWHFEFLMNQMFRQRLIIFEKWKYGSQQLLNLRATKGSTSFHWISCWTKSCKQIHEIKQNRFFYGMFYSWIFTIFPGKRQNLVFRWSAGYSLSNPKISWFFLKFPNVLRSKVLSCSAAPEATRTLTVWW